MKKKICLFSFLGILLLGPASLVFAIGGTTGPTTTDGKVNTTEDVMTVLDSITNWMFTIFMAVAVIMIVYAAFVYLTAGGSDRLKSAHKMVVYSVVAIAVAILAKGIVAVVESIITAGV